MLLNLPQSKLGQTSANSKRKIDRQAKCQSLALYHKFHAKVCTNFKIELCIPTQAFGEKKREIDQF